MTTSLANITFDCADPARLAEFWSAALGRAVDPGGNQWVRSIGKTDTTVAPAWLFVQVPEPKTAKNRCHVDLHAGPREAVTAEAERLVGLGATVLRPGKEEYGMYWATLQDPEGNEFCIGGD